MGGILIISILLNITMIVIFFFVNLELTNLKKENSNLKKRKVKASDEMIRSFEKAMIEAIDVGDLERYKEYRDMYNDLIPISIKTSSKKKGSVS